MIECDFMRFIPSSCLMPGMITSKDLYGYNNELMLSKNHVLSETEIHRINHLELQGIYISDELSRDIDVKSVINSKLRNNTIKAIKNIYMQVEDGNISVNASSMSRLRDMVNDIIDEITINKNAIINMLDLKTFDDYTYNHSVNVAVISIVFGVSMGFSKTKLYELGLGALLHDIGKVFVPIEILEKKRKLTEDEFRQISEHSLKGSNYLREKWVIPIESNIAVLNHHERYNGTGYPYQLRGDKISELGKILAVADVFDALTSNRAYRDAFLPSDAMEYIMGGSGTFFDPKIVSVFAKKVVPYPAGTSVILSNGLKGLVVENYMSYCMRPKVKIISNQTDYYLDLCNDRKLLNVTIVGITNI
jgi:HD-GYP domain-containing protein (c-di-GMP phosphodiesterase class II)